jgi:hypothetical protein
MIKSIKKYNLRGRSVGITDKTDLCSRLLRWPQVGMPYTPSLLTVGLGVKVILWILRQFHAAKLVLLMEGIYEVSRLERLRWHDIDMFSNNGFRHSSNIMVITETFERLQ